MAKYLTKTDPVEVLVEHFLQIIIDAKDKSAQYSEVLDRVQMRVTTILPLVNQIEELNAMLNRPRDEVQKLIDLVNDGQALVKKCTGQVWWQNIWFKRSSYAWELQQLEQELDKYLKEIMLLQRRRDQMELMVKINQLHATIPVVGSSAVPEAPKFAVGVEVHLMELKACLLARSDIRMIVVSAPAGYGKTTLIKKLCHDDEIKGHFGDRIYFITLSRTFKAKETVRRILEQTNQNIEEFQNDEDAMNQLSWRLRSIAIKVNQPQRVSPVLLVVDDVWTGAESFLERIQFEIEGYKILVTSRFVFLRFECTYHLPELNQEDAMRLFRQAAGLRDVGTDIPNELVEKIVKGCKGVPSTIFEVGRSLCRQPLSVWRRKEQEFSASQCTQDCGKSDEGWQMNGNMKYYKGEQMQNISKLDKGAITPQQRIRV